MSSAEDTSVTFNVLANDSDVDGDLLMITSLTNPLSGTVTLNPDSYLTYTPAANFHGLDSFTYTISDSQGGSDTAVVTVGLKNVNDPPLAVADTAVTNLATAVTIDVLANDSDVDNNPLIVTEVTQPLNGSVVINPEHTVTYTPLPCTPTRWPGPSLVSPCRTS